MQAPVLETPRLLLREHRVDDFEPLAAMWADPAVTRHIGGRSFSGEESWARLLRYAGHWALLGFGYWAIEEKAATGFAGEIGFAEYKRDLVPSLDGTPEIGWALAPRVHGRGFATEAAQAVTEWGDSHLRARRTACIIHPENAVSIRVADRCGYRELQRTTYKGQPTILFVRETPSIFLTAAGPEAAALQGRSSNMRSISSGAI
jgi:RimJ/RimL family protein N-acetyltransferase